MNRSILHIDLNSFFASVELLKRPELKGYPVAVCGSVEDRHGIVLAKTDEAKKMGVNTAEAIWEAKAKCPNLIIISPTYGEYNRYSEMVREIFADYTDLIEPFGIDEAWLDVTGSQRLFGSAEVIANTIRERVKAETGLTVSIGVSFNKVFAKLGSDLKKPDAVTIITPDNYKKKVWVLNANEMLGVGRQLSKKLSEYGICTIGDIAVSKIEFLSAKFGKQGEQIWHYANGLDKSEVCQYNKVEKFKSVGHGTTPKKDLQNSEEVRRLFLALSQDIARKLRKHNLAANGVRVSIRDANLKTTQLQTTTIQQISCFRDIAEAAYRLFEANYRWEIPVRSVTVTVYNLVESATPMQLDLFSQPQNDKKKEDAEIAIEQVRNKYGKMAINLCSIIQKN